MPLATGRTWTYEVSDLRLSQVVPMRVARKVSVDDVPGYELTGPLGTARLAWHGPRLVAETLGSTTYAPPIPLLDARIPPGDVLWSGFVMADGAVNDGHATLTHKTAETPFASHKVPAVETILDLRVGKRRIELDSWFVDGVGLIKQEEHVDDVETVRISMTTGP